MNFTITRQNLHAGLVAVSASIPTKTTLPVLSNILFETTEDGILMSGTDLDIAVRVRVPAEVMEGGSLTAPGKKLQEITKELPEQPVQVNTRGDQIELQCGRSLFKLPESSGDRIRRGMERDRRTSAESNPAHLIRCVQ